MSISSRLRPDPLRVDPGPFITDPGSNYGKYVAGNELREADRILTSSTDPADIKLKNDIDAFARSIATATGGRRGRGQRGGWPLKTVVNAIKGVASSISYGCLTAAGVVKSTASTVKTTITTTFPRSTGAASAAAGSVSAGLASAVASVDEVIAGLDRTQIAGIIFTITTLLTIFGIPMVPGSSAGIEYVLGSILSVLPSAQTMVTNVFSSGLSREALVQLAQIGGLAAVAGSLFMGLKLSAKIVSNLAGRAATSISDIATAAATGTNDESITRITNEVASKIAGAGASAGRATVSIATSASQGAISTGLGTLSLILKNVPIKPPTGSPPMATRSSAAKSTDSTYNWIAKFIKSITSKPPPTKETVVATVNTAITDANTSLTLEEAEVVAILAGLNTSGSTGPSNSASASSGNDEDEEMPPSNSSASSSSASSRRGGGRRTRKYRIKTKRAHYKKRSQKKSHRRRSQKNQ